MNEKLELLYEIKQIKNILKSIEERLKNIEDEVLGKNIVLDEEHDCDDIVGVDKTPNIDNTWTNAKNIIEREITEVSFNTWIKPVTLFKIEGSTIYLQVCNDFSKDILESRYMDLLNNAIYQEMGSEHKIEFMIVDENKTRIC